MKTLSQVKTLLAEAIEEGIAARKECEKRTESRCKKRVVWLKSVLLYLESGVEAGSIQTDRNRTMKLLQEVSKRRPVPTQEDGEKNPEFKKLVKKYESMYEVPKLKEQLKTLNFILNG